MSLVLASDMALMVLDAVLADGVVVLLLLVALLGSSAGATAVLAPTTDLDLSVLAFAVKVFVDF